MPENNANNQRVTNTKIFAKLESMGERLERVEVSTTTSATHSIRCAERWNLYDKDRARKNSQDREQIHTAQNTATIAGGRQLAIIAAIVAVVVAVINALSLVIQGAL